MGSSMSNAIPSFGSWLRVETTTTTTTAAAAAAAAV